MMIVFERPVKIHLHLHLHLPVISFEKTKATCNIVAKSQRFGEFEIALRETFDSCLMVLVVNKRI